MAVKIELRGRGPGRGALLVGRHFEAPESVLIAVERNDGRFLGVGGVWQTTPHWHPQFSVYPLSDGLHVDVGAEIVDGVIGIGGVPLRVLLRVDGMEDAGILRIKEELIGSDGAAPARPERGLDQEASQAPGWAKETLFAPSPPFVEETALRAPKPSRRWPWLLLASVLLAATVLGTAWYLGWLDPWSKTGGHETASSTEGPDSASHSHTESAVSRPPGPEPLSAETEPSAFVPQPSATSEPEAAAQPLSGLVLARDFLAGHPSADAIYARALSSDEAGDCEAALVLFNAAADAEPRYAAELARRYDPQTFVPGKCIDTADAPYAIVYFGDAARAGDVASQRRLGQLMTERERSGPTYEEGVAWLRKAASAGDEGARRALNALGE